MPSPDQTPREPPIEFCPDCGSPVSSCSEPGGVDRCPRCHAWLYRSLWPEGEVDPEEAEGAATSGLGPCSSCGSALTGNRCRPCRLERRRHGFVARLVRHLFRRGDPPHVLPLEEIAADAAALRHSIDVRRFERLRRSISAMGIATPIVVRPLPTGGYAIVDGLRRMLAARHLGLRSIPVEVRPLSESGAARWRLTVNLHREALSDLEEAEAFARAGRDHPGPRSILAASLGLDARRLGRILERFRNDPRQRERWIYRSDAEDPEVLARERQTLDEIRRAVESHVETTT